MCCGSTGEETSVSEAVTFGLGFAGCIGVHRVEEAFQAEGTAQAKAQKQGDQCDWKMVGGAQL